MRISVLALSSFAHPRVCLPQPSKGILQQMFWKQFWKAPGAHQNSLELLLPVRSLQYLWAKAPCGIQCGLSEVLGKSYKMVTISLEPRPFGLWV